jgi:anhydro-N-acetylmuramic acid kinase
MAMDQLATELSAGRENFDKGGKIAASGEPDIALLGELMRDPYYGKKPPKSAGREQYGAEFIARLKRTGRSLTDLIATAALLTATTAAQAAGTEPGDLIASGGGVHNAHLMSHLHALLPNMRIATTMEYGIDPDAKEAIAFALMAYETWHRRPSNVPSATGAKRAVILGEICY